MVLKKRFKIEGMHCESCKALIEDVYKEIPGAISCKVDFKTGKVIIEYEKEFDFKRFKKEIEDLGDYKVT